MAQLFFCYGAVDSSKTIEILEIAHSYQMQGRKVVLITSGKNDRDNRDITASGVSLDSKAIPAEDDMNIFNYVKKQDGKDIANDDEAITCILIDETQFLYRHHVLECARMIDKLRISVMTLGLRNDLQNDLLGGSQYLLLYTDKIEEMKTVCHYCSREAMMIIRVRSGKVVYKGV